MVVFAVSVLQCIDPLSRLRVEAVCAQLLAAMALVSGPWEAVHEMLVTAADGGVEFAPTDVLTRTMEPAHVLAAPRRVSGDGAGTLGSSASPSAGAGAGAGAGGGASAGAGGAGRGNADNTGNSASAPAGTWTATAVLHPAVRAFIDGIGATPTYRHPDVFNPVAAYNDWGLGADNYDFAQLVGMAMVHWPSLLAPCPLSATVVPALVRRRHELCQWSYPKLTEADQAAGQQLTVVRCVAAVRCRMRGAR